MARTWSRHERLGRVLDRASAKVARACQTPGADVLAACRAYQRLERYRIRMNHGMAAQTSIGGIRVTPTSGYAAPDVCFTPLCGNLKRHSALPNRAITGLVHRNKRCALVAYSITSSALA